MNENSNGLLIYNKNHLPIDSSQFEKYMHIFGSSSKGNSIYFKEPRFLIDMGFSYKKYIEYDPNFFLKIDFIFLTHEHSDHINTTTLLKVLSLYPAIRFVISTSMWEDMLMENYARRIDQKKLISYRTHFIFAKPMQLKNHHGLSINYIPHVTAHGPIKNCAVELSYLNIHLLYASDLDEFQANPARGTEGLPTYENAPFNILCLEANYDEKILYEYLKKHPNSFRAKQNLRHSSEQAAWHYVDKYMAKNGLFIPLHASKMFGTLLQNNDLDENKDD